MVRICTVLRAARPYCTANFTNAEVLPAPGGPTNATTREGGAAGTEFGVDTHQLGKFGPQVGSGNRGTQLAHHVISEFSVQFGVSEPGEDTRKLGIESNARRATSGARQSQRELLHALLEFGNILR